MISTRRKFVTSFPEVLTLKLRVYMSVLVSEVCVELEKCEEDWQLATLGSHLHDPKKRSDDNLQYCELQESSSLFGMITGSYSALGAQS